MVSDNVLRADKSKIKIFSVQTGKPHIITSVLKHTQVGSSALVVLTVVTPPSTLYFLWDFWMDLNNYLVALPYRQVPCPAYCGGEEALGMRMEHPAEVHII